MAGFRSRGTDPLDVRVVPHAAITLALEFGDGLLVVDTATGRRQRGNLVAGFMHDSVRVRGAGVECLQVRLSPAIARAVLGASPAELGRTVVTLDDVWGKDAARLRRRLEDTVSWPDRFALVEFSIARRMATGPAMDPEVAWAWRRIAASNGMIRIEELAAEIEWSRKRLWTRFGAQIGLPPKRAANLVRFDHAAHRLAAGHRPATVAADGGYVDQSHLNRDVQSFTGATPTTMADQQWLAVDTIAWPEYTTPPELHASISRAPLESG